MFCNKSKTFNKIFNVKLQSVLHLAFRNPCVLEMGTKEERSNLKGSSKINN